MTVLFFILLFIFLGLCALVCFIILIQESKSLGLGASFGGDPGDSVFGTSTAEVLKKFTAYAVGIFMISCILLSMWSGSLGRTSRAPLPTTIEETQEKA